MLYFIISKKPGIAQAKKNEKIVLLLLLLLLLRGSSHVKAVFFRFS